MDVVPFPSGQGFTGRNAWWEYIRSQSQRDRLDLLMAVALMNEQVGYALLNHDPTLFNIFEFSLETVAVLIEIKADTLEAFAQALVLKRNSDFWKSNIS